MKISLKRKIIIKAKTIISKIVLFVLYRGMNIVSKVDRNVANEIENWKEGYTIKIKTSEQGPSLAIKKSNKRIKKIHTEEKSNLEITFKSLDSAFLLLTGRMGISEAYAEHRFILKGDITEAMSFVRCIDIVETYLFPKIISKNLVKEIKKRKIPILLIYLRILINF